MGPCLIRSGTDPAVALKSGPPSGSSLSGRESAVPDDRVLMSVASQGELRLAKQAPEQPRLPWPREFAAAVAEAACRPCDQRAEVKDRGRIVRRAFRLAVLSSMAGGGRPRFHPDCQHDAFDA